MKVLVIGDSCVDNFIYCDINRICPEAPVPVLQPIESTTNPGMASNVARNLISLGAEVELITNEINIRKTRYIDIKSGQMIMRLDENDNCDEFEGEYDSSGYDAVIISDYNKGFLKEEDIFLLSFLWRAMAPSDGSSDATLTLIPMLQKRSRFKSFKKLLMS